MKLETTENINNVDGKMSKIDESLKSFTRMIGLHGWNLNSNEAGNSGTISNNIDIYYYKMIGSIDELSKDLDHHIFRQRNPYYDGVVLLLSENDLSDDGQKNDQAIEILLYDEQSEKDRLVHLLIADL